MIFAISEKHGVRVTIHRNDEILEDLAELSAVIESYKNALYNEVPHEVADALITAAGKLAYSDGEKEIHAVMDELSGLMSDVVKEQYGDMADGILEAIDKIAENE